MAVEYKSTWKGKFSHAVILSGKEAANVLYYETGFEQLHPIPPIHAWMSERGYEYYKTWNCVVVTPREEWAIVFPDKEICELFMMKWL